MQDIFGRLGFPETKRLIKFYEESWKAFPPPTALSRLYRVQVNRWDKGWNALAYAGIPSVTTSHFISSDKTADCHWPFVSQGIRQSSPSLLNSARLKLLHFFCNNNTSQFQWKWCQPCAPYCEVAHFSANQGRASVLLYYRYLYIFSCHSYSTLIVSLVMSNKVYWTNALYPWLFTIRAQILQFFCFRKGVAKAEYLPLEIRLNNRNKCLHPAAKKNAKWIEVCSPMDKACRKCWH